ncbi:glycosyltransferase family 9 protein [Propionimicrobium sp. PCR01-08-3]|uniref:glycosyltransferase family 9 protein n=1 Tax=Propionimicrobium sp. PCR01-08-3 TaxID=3052086 RepID=UPI00255C518C|nr:glycosyltransferase family 9 protein [Propionimicrobium sp. PCR01-08-3]WIY82166.1 glycosyltransferase family 9 protein [Propionimicrobium sp. PCR01-08-3]
MTNVREAVGPLGPVFEDVHRIAVLRGGGLGDLLFALPAMEALADAYPGAEITLLGTPLHRELFEGRPGPVHDVEVLPFAQGVRDGQVDDDAVDAFFTRMRAREFDLAVQVHGGGRFSNPFLLNLGARHTVGTRTDDAAPLERNLPYLYYQHEVLRALEVVGLAGATTAGLTPRIQVMDADRAAAADALTGTSPNRPRLVLHPGATDARRRWASERFAQVARWAAEDGFDVDVIGDASEQELARQVVAEATVTQASAEPPAAGAGTIRSLAGRLSIGGLVGLLEAADVMVGNDSGPRHLAQAVGTATVGIYWVGNVINAAPLGRCRHRMHIGWVTHCPVCGADVTQVGWTAEKCDHTFPLNDAVEPRDVYADVRALAGAPGETAAAGEQADHGQDSSCS